MTNEQRFWKKIRKPDFANGCWEWLGYLDPKGYGTFGVNNKVFKAHRYSYLIHFGPIPEKLCVCHHCDNPQCCNPDHLFLGTHNDNMQDMIKKGRSNFNGSKKEIIDELI